MVAATATRTVSAPIGTVWAVLADHEGMSSWAPGLSATLTTPGTGDRNGVGAVRRLDTKLPLPAIVERITAFEPETRLEYRALAGVPLKNYSGEVRLAQAGGQTRISYTVRADQRVPLVEGLAVKAVARALLAGLVRAVDKAA